MKTLLALAILVFASSVAGAQKGDIYVTSNGRTNSQPQSSPQPDPTRGLTGPSEWPKRPEVYRSAPSNYRLFVTKFLVNNESNKQIREIKWTATLINRETRETIGTFPLQTRKKIGAHKSATLKERLVVPLKKLRGQVVSATQPTDPNKPVPIDEKYEIIEIIYADKSVSRP